jgi:hypothetical protein
MDVKITYDSSVDFIENLKQNGISVEEAEEAMQLIATFSPEQTMNVMSIMKGSDPIDGPRIEELTEMVGGSRKYIIFTTVIALCIQAILFYVRNVQPYLAIKAGEDANYHMRCDAPSTLVEQFSSVFSAFVRASTTGSVENPACSREYLAVHYAQENQQLTQLMLALFGYLALMASTIAGMFGISRATLAQFITDVKGSMGMDMPPLPPSSGVNSPQVPKANDMEKPVMSTEKPVMSTTSWGVGNRLGSKGGSKKRSRRVRKHKKHNKTAKRN